MFRVKSIVPECFQCIHIHQVGQIALIGGFILTASVAYRRQATFEISLRGLVTFVSTQCASFGMWALSQ